MSDVLLRSSSATFMYRDFQSRNVMIRMETLGLLTFKEDEKGRFIMILLLSCGKPKQNILIAFGKNCYRNI